MKNTGIFKLLRLLNIRLNAYKKSKECIDEIIRTKNMFINMGQIKDNNMQQAYMYISLIISKTNEIMGKLNTNVLNMIDV